ncbi:progestin and adipoQ receptor family member 3-like [Ornithodoros turicata]|uniref:progestin and adipoQ receptor family member 3-like n=1 Tax=Ornithodoros turicata TaxID=34597 RepID=UPI003138660C
MSDVVSNARALGSDVADRIKQFFFCVSPMVAERVFAAFDIFPVSSLNLCVVPSFVTMTPFTGVAALLDFFSWNRNARLFKCFWVQRLSLDDTVLMQGFQKLFSLFSGVVFVYRKDGAISCKNSFLSTVARCLSTLNSMVQPSKCSLSIEDVPEYMRHNAYIKLGYRDFVTTRECLRGIFSWHNETVNIWSNLLTVIILAILTVNDYKFRYDPVSTFDRYLSTAMSASYATMLVLSMFYHVFNCCSEKAFRFWYLWDFFGIWLSMITYTAGFTVLQFRRHLVWQCVYLITEAVIALFMCCLTFIPSLRKQEWDDTRTQAVGWFVVFSLLPLVHSECINPESVVRATAFGHWAVIGTLVLSFLVFSTRFPEAWHPGTVDLVGSSHQIWHIGISLSVVVAHELYFAYIEAYGKLASIQVVTA